MGGTRTVKRFFSRMNRGLVLGLILILLLVGFVVTDNLRFEGEKAEITDNIVQYITDLANLNDGMESSAGTAIGDADQQRIRAGLAEILDRYYADPTLASRITVYDGYDASEIPESLSLWLGRTAAFDLQQVRVDAESDEFQITFERQGYSYAFVQINNLPVEYVTVGISKKPSLYLGAGPSYLIEAIYPEGSELFTSLRSTEILISGSLYLTREEGEWKILMSELYTKSADKIQ